MTGQQPDLRACQRLVFSDIGTLFDARDRLKPLGALSPEARSVVASAKVLKTNFVSGDLHREEVHEVKLWDKLRALEMLAKYFKLLEEQVQVTGDWDKLAARLASARERSPKPPLSSRPHISRSSTVLKRQRTELRNARRRHRRRHQNG